LAGLPGEGKANKDGSCTGECANYYLRQAGYWTHADGDGFFYVIDLADIETHTGKPIKAKINEASHGKLLWDESSLLQNTGYATSTGEPHLFIIDMKTHEQIGTFDFSAQSGCFGSHSIAFSSANQHVYIECTGPGGLLEIDVSNPRDPEFVAQHLGITGSLYETPDEMYVAVTDKGGNKFHLLQPGATSETSSVDYSIDVLGHPQGPVWYSNPKEGVDNSISALDYKTCLSLTINTNQNHYNSDGELVCDYYDCSQATTAGDVENGVCLYSTLENGQESKTLLQAEIAQIEDVKSGKAPFEEACKRCQNANNYDELDGLCTCTPACGSCAPNAKEDHDGKLSGAVCMDMNKLLEQPGRRLEHVDVEVTFVQAGSIKQGSPYSYSPECGFGRTYRPHKRGGVYDALPTNYPKPSLSLIDMSDFSLKCTVELPGDPSRVVYVPPSGNEIASSLSTGAILGFATAGLVGSILILAVIHSATKRKGANQFPTEANDEQDTEVAGGELM